MAPRPDTKANSPLSVPMTSTTPPASLWGGVSSLCQLVPSVERQIAGSLASESRTPPRNRPCGVAEIDHSSAAPSSPPGSLDARDTPSNDDHRRQLAGRPSKSSSVEMAYSEPLNVTTSRRLIWLPPDTTAPSDTNTPPTRVQLTTPSPGSVICATTAPSPVEVPIRTRPTAGGGSNRARTHSATTGVAVATGSDDAAADVSADVVTGGDPEVAGADAGVGGDVNGADVTERTDGSTASGGRSPSPPHDSRAITPTATPTPRRQPEIGRNAPMAPPSRQPHNT
jgi:hypothetical protein